MQEINLLQNKVKDRTLQYERSNRLVIGLFVILLIIEIIGGVGLYFLTSSTNNQTTNVTNQNQAITNSINQSQSDLTAATGLQGELKNVQVLLTGHIFWTSFFSQLSALTPKKVAYTSMTGSASDDKVHLEGQGQSYTDIGQLILSLSTSGKFTDVKLLSVSPATSSKFGYGFSMDVTASGSIFKKQP